jgi:WD40 repeat protein
LAQDQIVSASYDKILRSWDVETGRQVRTFSGHGQSTLAVVFDPSGSVIASG